MLEPLNVSDAVYKLERQYPSHSSTFGACANNCGRCTARGSGECKHCITDRLAENVGRELADNIFKARENLSKAIREAANREYAIEQDAVIEEYLNENQ